MNYYRAIELAAVALIGMWGGRHWWDFALLAAVIVMFAAVDMRRRERHG